MESHASLDWGFLISLAPASLQNSVTCSHSPINAGSFQGGVLSPPVF